MWIALALLVVLLMLGGAAMYLLYAALPAVPLEQGTLAHRQLAMGSATRGYHTYVPRELVPDSPLVIALHGQGQDSASMRALAGRALERQARVCGFAVAYPGALDGGWNTRGATPPQADDVGFIEALIQAMAAEHAIDSERVYVLGYDQGGQMAYRLALAIPQRVAGVAVIAASLAADLETPDDDRPVAATVPLLIINGTADRLNPFNGGEGNLFGLLRRPAVRSAMATAQHFADRADARLQQDETSADLVVPRLAPLRSVWSNAEGSVVVLYAVKGGGHVLHQPYARQPRWLGAMNPRFDVAEQAAVFWQL